MRVEAAVPASVAGFESIFDPPSTNTVQGHFVDSWDDCVDCNVNCEECDNN